MNAKETFLKHVEDKIDVLCAFIILKEDVILRVGYSEKDYEEFLEKMNIGSILDGYIWYKDLTWSKYKACYWEYMICPPIPESCYDISIGEEPAIRNKLNCLLSKIKLENNIRS